MTRATLPAVGVVGAGTMGAGIAQVAAWAGHDVVLYDVADAPLERGLASIASFLQAGVDRGKHTKADADAALTRIRGAVAIADLAAAELVVEAAPEALDIKRDLFARLSEVVAPDALLASNTSTLSIASIFAGIPNAERTLGMHFFNPAPLMPLVEVIRGPLTSPATVQRSLALTRAWGKHPVEAADTPGFIVNRVARPFYGEALRLLGEGVADVATIDMLVRDGGFRMGPFELMDLIGIDVNYAAARSVFDGFFGDPRFRPHPIQRAMVESGRLGRKTGRGYYDHEEEVRSPNTGTAEAPDGDGHPSADERRGARRVMVLGEPGEPLADDVRSRFRAAGIEVVYDRASLGSGNDASHGTIDAGIECSVVDTGIRGANLERLERQLPADAPIMACCHASDATTVAAGCVRPHRITGFSLYAPLADRSTVECAAGLLTDDAARLRAGDVWRSAGLDPTWVADSAGMVLPRIVACLVNEAAFALGEGAATADDIDRAMLLGTRYPRGPLAWASLVGLHQVAATMNALAETHGEDRYRLAPTLRQMVVAGRLRDVTW